MNESHKPDGRRLALVGRLVMVSAPFLLLFGILLLDGWIRGR